ncbi:YadA-like family protein [Veillonella magna]|uniref:YadA-like family protein n=1 Tax=Veillonella magna TaxID=464322 RepID=A0ABS2GCK8_9FIRM|nr:YadA-like family protein [Veillonella magna]MBM6911886.1 YadA-like family protein [Veillonella magna]
MKKKKSHVAALLAVTALTSIPGVFAADTGTAVATEAPTYVDITINNIKEDTGLELGTGARARGNGSIATGTNSLALGKNAVATGGNETQTSILDKLEQNKQRLQEIQTAQETTDRLMKEVQDIRKQQADVIEAGERVKQVRQSKATAKTAWDTALKAYNDAVASSAADIQAAQSKIDDFNSRLTAVSRIPNVDISSEEGITRAATQFKSMVEDGTSMNMDIDFYKDYITSYYKAEGDLRNSKLIISKTDNSAYIYNYYSSNWSANVERENIKNPYINLPNNSTSYLRYGIGINEGALSFTATEGAMQRTAFVNDPSITPPSGNLLYFNPDTDIATEAEWKKFYELAPQYKIALKQYIDNTNDPFMTSEVKTASLNLLNTKIDIWTKNIDAAYYQGQYEATHNTIWLDKKKQALDEYNMLISQFESLPSASGIKSQVIENYRKTHITDIQERNKVTTDTLTSELSKALNINKDAVQQIQNKLANLKQQADEAKQTYENINPSAADVALAAQYDQVMQDLLNKSNSLKAEQERLNALKKALTLNDLTNVGENAMAIGTDALSTGSNSMAIGTNTISTGENSIAIGKGSAVTGTNSIAVGTGHIVIGNNAGTFGDPSTIYGDGSYAIGNNNTIGSATTPHTVGTNTFVLGNDVTTTANNAVILGYGSTGRDNTVSVGKAGAERKIIHVADATLSSSSTDAVTGRQLWATNENISGFSKQITKNAESLKGLSTSVSNSLESIAAMSDGLSTMDTTKADASLTNLSEAGKTVISEAATAAVQNYMKSLKNEATTAPTMNRLQVRAFAPTRLNTSYLTTSLLALPSLSSEPAGDVTAEELAVKADRTYVDTKLSQKADIDSIYTKAETDRKLSKKADFTDMTARFASVDSKLNQKADKDSVYTKTETDTKVLQSTMSAMQYAEQYADQRDAELATSFREQLSQTKSELTRDINRVGAGAAALTALHPGDFDPDNKFEFSAGYGHYKGANAGAIGAYYHPNEDTLVSLAGTVGNGSPMVNAGVTFKVGSGNSQNTFSKTRLTKELRTVKEENEQLRAQNERLADDVETLKQQVERLMKQK